MSTDALILQMRRLLQEMKPLEAREAAMKEQLKIVAADAAIELFPEGPEYAEMKLLYAELKSQLVQRVVAGETFDGMTAVTTKKEVVIDMQQAVHWAWLLGNTEWLTLTPEAVKELTNAVKDRKYEVPLDVARYTETHAAIIYADKILSTRFEED